MRKKFVKWKILCFFFVVALIVTLISATVYAAEYTFGFGAETADLDYAGTDSSVIAGFRFIDGTEITKVLDGPGNDHERGDYREYFFTEEMPEPWMITHVILGIDGSDAWICSYLKIFLPSFLGYHRTNSMEIWHEFDNSEKRYYTVSTKRAIYGYSNYDNWGGTFYVDKNSNSTRSYSWNRLITDQYGTYNPMPYADPPIMTYELSNTQIGKSWMTFTEPTISQNASLSIKEKELYDAMAKHNIGSLTLTARLGFLTRSTSNYDDADLKEMKIGNANYYVKEKNSPFTVVFLIWAMQVSARRRPLMRDRVSIT